ncbi:hypothetical protein ACXM0N_09665 [Peribacillus simplex]
MKSLTELVEIYYRNHARNEDWKLSDFKNRCKLLEDLIEDAVWGKEPRLNRDKHQFRVPKQVLDEMVKILQDQAIVEEIKRCQSFDDILRIIYENRIKKFGSLAVYDTSLRLGAAFGHYPTVVYLHQGALDGANKLLGKDVVRKNSKYFCGNPEFPYISTDILPEPLSKVEPYHIENFLCIYKNNLKLNVSQ